MEPQCRLSSGGAEDDGGRRSVGYGGLKQVPDSGVASGVMSGGIEWLDDEEDTEDKLAVTDVSDTPVSGGLPCPAVEDDRVLLVDGDCVMVAPDGGWGWMIVMVSFLCASVVDGLCSVFGVMLPDLVVYFDQSSSTVAMAGSLLAGGFLLFGTSYDNSYTCLQRGPSDN